MDTKKLAELEAEINLRMAMRPKATWGVVIVVGAALLLATPAWPLAMVMIPIGLVAYRHWHMQDTEVMTLVLSYAPHEHGERFKEIAEACSILSRSGGLWLASSVGTPVDWKHAAGAQTAIDRVRITCQLDKPRFIDTNVSPWTLRCMNDSFVFLPDCVLIVNPLIPRCRVLPYEAISAVVAPDYFAETDSVPHDAVRVGATWLHPRMDGGPDRRFRHNREIPIMEYARLDLTVRYPESSTPPLTMRLQISNRQAAERIANCFSTRGGRKEQSERPNERESRESQRPHSRERTRAGQRDPYDVLGVSAEATDDDVRAAYRARVREYHPDRVASMGSRLREVATEEMKDINRAWESVRAMRGMPN